jgi:hypothetical protein
MLLANYILIEDGRIQAGAMHPSSFLKGIDVEVITAKRRF